MSKNKTTYATLKEYRQDRLIRAIIQECEESPDGLHEAALGYIAMIARAHLDKVDANQD